MHFLFQNMSLFVLVLNSLTVYQCDKAKKKKEEEEEEFIEWCDGFDDLNIETLQTS